MPIAAVSAGALIDPTTFGNAVANELNALSDNNVAKTSGTDQAGIAATPTDITGLSLTWTADPARAYKITLCVQITTSVAQTPLVAITDAAGTVIISRNVTTPAAAASASLHIEWVETGLSGSITRKARGSVASGTLTIVNSSNRNGILIVQDIGAA